jgi:hypothetical protein
MDCDVVAAAVPGGRAVSGDHIATLILSAAGDGGSYTGDGGSYNGDGGSYTVTAAATR